MSSVEENKEVVRRLLHEVVNQRRLIVANEIVASECIFHGSDGQTVIGVDVMKQMLTTFFNAFDNFRVAIEDMIGEGDKIVVRFLEMGMHQGEFEGIAPTGKEVTWTEMAIFRVEKELVVEAWTLEDRLSLMQQLGAIPTN
ncbi:MAG: ester cyclase [Dehalococcoidia bacterium]|nr:MAG: ester cyclase [Dehalococcoidia bacterium]